MKYSSQNEPLVCMMTNSTNFKRANNHTIRGVLIHCTGAPNPNLKRYVQPSNDDPNYAQLMQILGKNTNGNDWNHITLSAGVNAWIGKTAAGEVTTVQTLPWEKQPWGCGSGKNGSCNNGWIQYECCEDNLNDQAYFDAVYREACELTAYLCRKYNINPLGKAKHYSGIMVPTILCHYDSYKLGLGSNHGDVYNWFNKFNKTMDDFRNDVNKILIGKEDEDMLTQEQFNEFMNNYLVQLAKEDGSSWSEASRQWAVQNGIFAGDGTGNFQWKNYVTREQLAAIVHRLENK